MTEIDIQSQILINSKPLLSDHILKFTALIAVIIRKLQLSINQSSVQPGNSDD